MSEPKTSVTFWRSNSPILWAAAVTLLIVTIFVAAGFLHVCETNAQGVEKCRTKAKYLLYSPPNEIGDTLAGFAGALAFVWLIATVWLQSQELAAQRKEIADQSKATQDMAKSMQAQFGLLDQERLERTISLRDREMGELLKGLRWQFSHKLTGSIRWRIEKLQQNSASWISFQIDDSDGDIDSHICAISDHIALTHTRLKAHNELGAISRRPSRELAYESFITTMDEILELEPEVSTSERIKMKRYGIEICRKLLSEIWDDDRFWSQDSPTI